jgi:hypothetical protein
VASEEDEVFIDEGEEAVDEHSINCLEVIRNGLEDIADEGRAAFDKGEVRFDGDEVFICEIEDSADARKNKSDQPEQVLEWVKRGVELTALRFRSI